MVGATSVRALVFILPDGTIVLVLWYQAHAQQNSNVMVFSGASKKGGIRVRVIWTSLSCHR